MNFRDWWGAVLHGRCVCCSVRSWEALCGSCAQQVPLELRTPRGVVVRSAARYDSSAGRLVRRLKYNEETFLASRLAHALAPSARRFPPALLVPVPLHPLRLAERGYNQGALIARTLGQLTPLTPRLDLLHRTRHTRAQARVSGAERRKNVLGAFAARKMTHHRPIVLLDDVVTTGSTLDACAKALEAAGHQVIAALSVVQGS